MKTKLIILMAAVVAVLYSCSADRDENITPVEKTSKQELKLNQGRGLNEKIESSISIDTIRSFESPSAAPPPIPLTPEDGGDPKDVPPRK